MPGWYYRLRLLGGEADAPPNLVEDVDDVLRYLDDMRKTVRGLTQEMASMLTELREFQQLVSDVCDAVGYTGPLGGLVAELSEIEDARGRGYD